MSFPNTSPYELDTISFDEYLIDKPDCSFLFQVTSANLAHLSIIPGDIVLIERTTQANSGDIVLMETDREYSLQVLDKEHLRGEEIRLLGKIKAVVRKY